MSAMWIDRYEHTHSIGNILVITARRQRKRSETNLDMEGRKREYALSTSEKKYEEKVP